MESYEGERYHALRLNALKEGAKDAACLGFARLTGVPWAENGYYYQAGDQPGRHPFHAAGVYYIPLRGLVSDTGVHNPHTFYIFGQYLRTGRVYLIAQKKPLPHKLCRNLRALAPRRRAQIQHALTGLHSTWGRISGILGEL